MRSAPVGSGVSEGADEERDDAHIAGVDAGAGCTEIWEYLSERRDRARRRGADDDSGDDEAEE